MKKNNPLSFLKKGVSRRSFLTATSALVADFLIHPFSRAGDLNAAPFFSTMENTSQVAVTRAYNYNRSSVRQKILHLFDSLGGITDIMKPGEKVAIKINLTGGMGAISVPGGVDVRESVWTHPEVLRAVGELILDCGVNASDLYIVEALWDQQSYTNYGYEEVQQSLGAQLINLNSAYPYADFIDKETGENHFYYSSFKFNRILSEADVFVSIPKMKQHYDAGVTHSMKNLVGLVPMHYYTLPENRGMRAALHYDGGNIRTHLPRSICDLNMARPIHLGIIDGIKNAIGGEGPWNPTFQPATYNWLMAGKDPVALDSIASKQMGNNPESSTFWLPNGEQCDNYLMLARQKGLGTNILGNIELVGNGANEIISSSPKGFRETAPDKILLFRNYPNPFSTSTTVRYFLPEAGNITLKIFDMFGREIETLADGYFSKGEHTVQWSINNHPAGVYICRLQAGRFSETIKLHFMK
ncbi:MAG: DUF362 domain-containing protein [Bacteroidales bacterium]|nr:DUF362 domain-containing protein [Bacteroidales bacterium]